jgi:hypothetical protein
MTVRGRMMAVHVCFEVRGTKKETPPKPKGSEGTWETCNAAHRFEATSNEQKTERSVFHGAGWPVTLCRALVDDLQPCFSVTAQAGPGPGPFSEPGRKVETLAVNGYAHGTWLCVTSQ